MRHEPEAASPLSLRVNVARLPRDGMPVVIEADERQREALAREHGVLAVESLRAELRVAEWKRHGVHVGGRVEARVVQECVATLEPIENAVSEPVDAVFVPEDSKLGRLGFGEGGEILLDPDGPDAPETFSGDTIDVGALAEQFFGLGIDPYPRKPGAATAAPADEPAAEPDTDWRRKLSALARRE